jgi:uncharacterized protein (DUF58 family)
MATRRPRGWQRVWRRLRPPRRLRFTREGNWFVFLALAVGVAAVNTGNNLLYLLLAWLLSFIIASGVLSELTMRGLRVTRRPAPEVFAGQPFLMEIAVANGKAGLASFSIEIEDLVGGRPLDKKCYFLKIPPGKTQRTSYRHTFARRGEYHFDGFRIATRFPFTLFRKSRDTEDGGAVVVFPRLSPVPRLPPRPRHLGAGTSDRLGRHGEFFGLREYKAGDDRRTIHWRSTARTGRLLVREVHDESERRVAIVVDHAVPPAVARALAAGERLREDAAIDDAVERAIALAGSHAASYLEHGWAVALYARGATVPLGRGRGHLIRILRALAILPPATDATPLPAGEAALDRVLIVPRGVAAAGRPGADHVLEA